MSTPPPILLAKENRTIGQGVDTTQHWGREEDRGLRREHLPVSALGSRTLPVPSPLAATTTCTLLFARLQWGCKVQFSKSKSQSRICKVSVARVTGWYVHLQSIRRHASGDARGHLSLTSACSWSYPCASSNGRGAWKRRLQSWVLSCAASSHTTSPSASLAHTHAHAHAHARTHTLTRTRDRQTDRHTEIGHLCKSESASNSAHGGERARARCREHGRGGESGTEIKM